MGMGVAPCCGDVIEATEENLLKLGWSEKRVMQWAEDQGCCGEIEDLNDALWAMAIEDNAKIISLELNENF